MIAQGSGRLIIVLLLLAIIVTWINTYVGILSLVLVIYVLWFFRDPRRSIQYNAQHFLAAADGTVQYVERTDEGVRVAVRMSPFDVHINRSPISGQVTTIHHKPGSHRSVYFAGAENKNEQNLIVIENETFQANILQITGIFARRIECWLDEGDRVSQGDKIGIIRFGSQTNVVITSKHGKKDIKPIVSKGDRVKAGLTVIAVEGA